MQWQYPKAQYQKNQRVCGELQKNANMQRIYKHIMWYSKIQLLNRSDRSWPFSSIRRHVVSSDLSLSGCLYQMFLRQHSWDAAFTWLGLTSAVFFDTVLKEWRRWTNHNHNALDHDCQQHGSSLRMPFESAFTWIQTNYMRFEKLISNVIIQELDLRLGNSQTSLWELSWRKYFLNELK